MKKLLPKTLKNPQGFTLVELLVVITIIAILAIVGFTVFSGLQRGARDARRRADIDAIAKALEVNKTQNLNTYNPLQATWFASGNIPTDTTAQQYCILTNSSGTPVGNPSQALVNAWTGNCPTGWAPIAAGVPGAVTTNWRICARLETQPSAGNFEAYCQGNSQ